jgi:hypothetical protein
MSDETSDDGRRPLPPGFPKSINLIESAKTGEVVPRKDEDGNWTYRATELPPPDCAEATERELTVKRKNLWFGRFRNR